MTREEIAKADADFGVIITLLGNHLHPRFKLEHAWGWSIYDMTADEPYAAIARHYRIMAECARGEGSKQAKRVRNGAER